jgi:NADH-quinone oxidoreductase subunit K
MQSASNVIWNLSVSHFLVLAAVLFTVGAFGALLRRNALIVLMSVELMLNAGNMTLLAFSRLHHDMRGHVFSLFVIAIAAAEAAVGLAIVVGVFRSTRHANVDRLTTLKH